MRLFAVQKTEYGAGKGVFAQQYFHSGDNLFVFGERVVSWTRATHRAIQLGRNRWLEPEKESFGHYLNHSCDPNAGFKLPNKIVASREIKKGEEVVIDYSTAVHTSKWEMSCLCQKTKCRKRVRSFQFLPRELQEKYREWNSWENE